MPIDWFTVGAQAINFLILVWLMKRFLYGPILDAIDAREKRVAAELADADARKAEARRERDEFHQKIAEIDRQRAKLLSRAEEEAKAARQRLIEEARNDADDLRVRREDALNREQQLLHETIRRRTQEEVFAIARKTLMDLAGVSLEERINEVFTRQLRELNGETKDGLMAALQNPSAPVVVRSGFDLTSEQQEAIRRAVHDTLAQTRRQIRFETVPDVICGIELTVNGRKAAWSIAEYLELLKNSIDGLLEHPADSGTKAEAKAHPPIPPAAVEEPR
jgi:F-type H+-transporting ATPase subunit b